MGSESLNILIVEDEPLIASGISCCLEELGHKTVGIASTGKEALEMAPALKPDLILMDINIPDLDGIIVMERLSKVISVPCIFLTGYSDQDLIRRASRVNSYGYLIKPVDVNDLNAAINIAIQRSKEMHEKERSLIQSRQALEDRKIVERAKGILMDQYEMQETQAMRFLQKKSRESNRKLPEVAKEIVEFEARLKKR